MEFNSSRHILFVVGMHRSGTSALCAALQACGASFGARLLDAMEGVNDQGFWESTEVVGLNDNLLQLLGVQWYSVASSHLLVDWAAPEFEELRREARELIQRGFGAGPVEVVKDPRLCITLPFWTSVCREAGLRTSVCVISRAPMDVCRSLEKRDGFPLGYGLRLLQIYVRGIAHNVPQDTLYVTYEQLLEDPVGLMQQVAAMSPLTVTEAQLASAVDSGLRHHTAAQDEDLPSLRDCGTIDFEALELEVAAAYPVELTLSQFATNLVARGRELTRIGHSYSVALSTIDERDGQIRELDSLHMRALATIEERDGQIRELDRRLQEMGSLHARALATIDERDGQVSDFDRKLAEVGSLHSQAVQVINDKDAHLQRIFRKPILGLMFRAIWKYETR